MKYHYTERYSKDLQRELDSIKGYFREQHRFNVDDHLDNLVEPSIVEAMEVSHGDVDTFNELISLAFDDDGDYMNTMLNHIARYVKKKVPNLTVDDAHHVLCLLKVVIFHSIEMLRRYKE